MPMERAGLCTPRKPRSPDLPCYFGLLHTPFVITGVPVKISPCGTDGLRIKNQAQAPIIGSLFELLLSKLNEGHDPAHQDI